MTSKILEVCCFGGRAGRDDCVVLRSGVGGHDSGDSATDALQKARVLDRLAEGMAVERKGTSPGFVLDPAWPQPLPNHWVIGDVGGIAVDKHDRIWVLHRPRSVELHG